MTRMEDHDKDIIEKRVTAGRATIAYALLAIPFIVLMAVLTSMPWAVFSAWAVLVCGALGLRALWSRVPHDPAP